LEVQGGESWSIIGPSGCGKTTLLYLLAGLKHPDKGTIMIAGTPILRPRPGTGLVLQDHGLLPWATARENARLGLTIRELYGPDGRHAPVEPTLDGEAAEKKVDYWLDRLGIKDVSHKYPSQLSRGQRQRTAIARTLVLEPDLLLMDEPFSALDQTIREDLQKVMLAFNAEAGRTNLLVTHDIEEAVFVGERILLLQSGTNRKPEIIPNQLAGRSESRQDKGFLETCAFLRMRLGGRL
jgi:NitT/TauT family transport system ATP-binding protein